jgi:hypothetical protein
MEGKWQKIQQRLQLGICNRYSYYINDFLKIDGFYVNIVQEIRNNNKYLVDPSAYILKKIFS